MKQDLANDGAIGGEGGGLAGFWVKRFSTQLLALDHAVEAWERRLVITGCGRIRFIEERTAETKMTFYLLSVIKLRLR
ncbi:hypothetical protein [Egbenema bharatensis]|uniref:hypothetical protein n=1 Tax=Egbenema bharatensis TaxID=3463334 RepID=UPI003A87410D